MNESPHEGEVIIQEAQTVKVESSRSSLGIPVAIIIGFALVAAALYLGPSGQGLSGLRGLNPKETENNNGEPSAPMNVTVGDLPTLGSPQAPVTMVEWGDYQCPFCGRFFEQVEPPLREQYVESGKVRFAFRDFAFLGKESTDAAMAARCANAQGRFWNYHDKLYSSQQGENQGVFSRDKLKGFAKELKLDTADFNTCLDSNKYEDAVAADTKAGRDAGVNGTPTTFVNGRVVNGAQPFDAFKKIIDEELSK